jgi:26S proteasome regulatory subunit N5
MERREKTEFILEQMRLLVTVARQKDTEVEEKEGKESLGGGEAEWVKVRVGGRKVNEEFLKDKDNEVGSFIVRPLVFGKTQRGI